MAKKSTVTKKSLLLEIPLELIHSQSIEWQEEIAFWKDEAAFLYVLVRSSPSSPLLKTKPAKAIERKLLDFTVRKFSDLNLEIQGHEKLLSEILRGKNKHEDILRRRHKIIGAKFLKMRTDFRTVKRKIFGLIKIKSTGMMIPQVL